MKIRGRIVLLSVIVLVLARFVAAALLPLSADEAMAALAGAGSEPARRAG